MHIITPVQVFDSDSNGTVSLDELLIGLEASKGECMGGSPK
jgi:hypothetical protein